MKETFGEFIRRLRNESRLTLVQLAALLDMDSANLSKIENGKRDFDEKRLDKLSKIFKVDIEKLKVEYLSDFIAKRIYLIDNSKDTLLLAEEKANYLRQKNMTKSKIHI